MATQLEDIKKVLESNDFDPEQLSDQTLSVVEDNKFMSTKEVDEVIVILNTILNRSYTKNKALANIFEATSLVSLKSYDMGGTVNLSRNQDCLDVIDSIGRNAKVDEAYPLKLAANGLALMAVDVKEQ